MFNSACTSDFQPHAGLVEDDRISAAVTARDIETILTARRRRADFFSPELFADPAWDMLLQLYALELKQQRISVSKLSISAAVPATTALRWINKLESDGLIRRDGDPMDARRYWISLTDAGSNAMRGYFDSASSRSVL